MGDRRRKEEQKAAAAQPPKDTSRRTTSFVSGAGIDREVITTDICRYLGNDALVKPGTYNDKNNQVLEGYFITAYRPLTSEQLRDIKADSAKWQEEKRRNRGPTGGYDSSDTRSRVWGEDARQSPSATYPPQPPTGNYGPPIQPPNPSMGRGFETYPPPNSMGPPGTFPQPRPPAFSNTSQDPSYVPYSQPLAVHSYGVDPRQGQRMDEQPRSMNPPYSGQQQQQQGQTMQQQYQTPIGRGGQQYYTSSTLPPSAPTMQYQSAPQDFQYGRAPGSEQMSYNDYPEQDEEMGYDDPPPAAPTTTTPTAQTRPNEGNRKRAHESHRDRRH